MNCYNKILHVLVVGVFSFQLASCGTLLYPERRGQTGGKVDIGVALLDGIGLFFFLVPGIIAFAVDFSNGSIYLPPGSAKNNTETKVVRFDQHHWSPTMLEQLIAQETGKEFKLDDQRLQMVRLKDKQDMQTQFARLKGKYTAIASAQ